MLQASSHAPARQRPHARPRTPEQETPETYDDTDDETAIDDDEVPKDAEIIIPHLALSKDPIVMTNTNHNDKIEEAYSNQTVQAFAKVCGRHWTYYVKELEISIGREQAGEIGDDSPPVHIDLGPSKVVSRTHAVVWYSHDDNLWHLKAHGRNGVRLDDEELKKGESKAIHCGVVIAIAGTEMLFQTPEQEPKIHQKYKDRVVRYDEEMDNVGLQDSFSNAHPPPPYYGISRPSYSGGAPFSPYPPVGTSYAGQPNIAPTPPGPARPVTPETSPPKPAAVGSTKKRTPPNRRGINGIMMESTEQIDYALDSSKEIKPACSYAAMITWAILSNPEQTLSLNDIYIWIKAHYSFYRYARTGWQVRETSTLLA